MLHLGMGAIQYQNWDGVWFITEMWLETHNIYLTLKHIFKEIDAMCFKLWEEPYIYSRKTSMC